VAYKSSAELLAGTPIDPVGIYGDFVKAKVIAAGSETTGFVWKDALRDLSPDLPALDSLEVPWEPMYLPDCAPGEYDAQTDSVTFTATETEFAFLPESAVWSLNAPVRIQVAKLVGGDNGSVRVLGNPIGGKSRDIWWQGITVLELPSINGEYVLRIYDGLSDRPAATIDLDRSTSEPIQVVFDQPEGMSFSVLDENNLVLKHLDVTTMAGVSLPNGLFPERKFYFGVTAPAHTPVTITALTVGTKPEGNWVEPVDIGPGLASLARQRDLVFGANFEIARMIDRRYCEAMQRDFNGIEFGDWTWVSPPFWMGSGVVDGNSDDDYEFDRVDRIVEYAQQRGWRVLGGVVWGEASAIPDWLKNGGYSRDEYIKILEQHIRTVVGRYQGRVQEWIIVNEASERRYWSTHDPATSLRDFWLDKIGPEYVEMAFRWAREADPDAVLIFNSGANNPPFDSHGQQIFNLMQGTVKDLKAKGVPIDGVGMQMHLLGPFGNQIAPQKGEVVEAMREFVDLGVKVYITEFEVDLGSTGGSQAERYEYQARIYRDMLDACLESGACGGFYVWGTTDSLSWIICPFAFPICLNEPNGDPLMFDRDFNPKPAYFAVSDTLAGRAYVALPTGPAQTSGTPPAPSPTPIPEPTRTPSPQIVLNTYDDFNNPAKDGSFDRQKWKLTGSSPSPAVEQRNGILTLADEGDHFGDISLVARSYDGFVLKSPMFLEANLAMATDSAYGSVNIHLSAIGLKEGIWFGGCTIERYSSQFRGNCSDIVWPQREGHSYETPLQSFKPGSWHTVRIEVEPATMTISYSIDGVVVGSHVPADADALRKARFQVLVGTWKPNVASPVIGLIDFVSIGQIGE